MNTSRSVLLSEHCHTTHLMATIFTLSPVVPYPQ